MANVTPTTAINNIPMLTLSARGINDPPTVAWVNCVAADAVTAVGELMTLSDNVSSGVGNVTWGLFGGLPSAGY